MKWRQAIYGIGFKTWAVRMLSDNCKERDVSVKIDIEVVQNNNQE